MDYYYWYLYYYDDHYVVLEVVVVGDIVVVVVDDELLNDYLFVVERMGFENVMVVFVLSLGLLMEVTLMEVV